MISKDELNAVNIRLDVAGEHALFVLLGSDGTINRQGTGEEDGIDSRLFVGVTTEPVFDEFMAKVKEESLQHPGVFSLPEQKGKSCRLVILFTAAGKEIGFDFSFGSESEGPPMEIFKWVERAVELTDPWYENQKRNVGS